MEEGFSLTHCLDCRCLKSFCEKKIRGRQVNIKKNTGKKKKQKQCESKRENAFESGRPEEWQIDDGDGRKKLDLMKKMAEVLAFSNTFMFAEGKRSMGGIVME